MKDHEIPTNIIDLSHLTDNEKIDFYYETKQHNREAIINLENKLRELKDINQHLTEEILKLEKGQKPTFKSKCPNCSHFMTKHGTVRLKSRGMVQKYRCSKCGTIRQENSY